MTEKPVPTLEEPDEGGDDKLSKHSRRKSRRRIEVESDPDYQDLAMSALASLVKNRKLSTAEELGLIPLEKPVILENEKETYVIERVVGCGSFGAVLSGKIQETGVPIALKRVMQDTRYKNRELLILKMLDHPCVVRLFNNFYSQNNPRSCVFLNVVMDYLPLNLHEAEKKYLQRHEPFPVILIKTFAFQTFRALTYLHAQNICHRDIKPQNILCNLDTGELRICDFGSAKILNPAEPNVSYICSRFYRAPELILGATRYTTAIDIWSVGCVLAELFLGRPIFAGDTNRQQIQMIMRVIGAPTRQQIIAMNKDYSAGTALPDIPHVPWEKVFRSSNMPDSDALDVINKILTYDPTDRPTAAKLLVHPWFSDLSKHKQKLPSGESLPKNLFDYSKIELEQVAALKTSEGETLPIRKHHKRLHKHKSLRSKSASCLVPPELGEVAKDGKQREHSHLRVSVTASTETTTAPVTPSSPIASLSETTSSAKLSASDTTSSTKLLASETKVESPSSTSESVPDVEEKTPKKGKLRRFRDKFALLIAPSNSAADSSLTSPSMIIQPGSPLFMAENF